MPTLPSPLWLAAWLCFVAPGMARAQTDLCEFRTSSEAADAGWVAKAKAGMPQPTLHLVKDAKAGRTALMAKGIAGQGMYGGLRFVQRIDLTGVGPKDKIEFWVKQNASNSVVINIDFDDGPNAHRSVAAKNGEWTRVVLSCDIKQWSGGRDAWGLANRAMFYTRAFDAPGEYLCLDGLRFPPSTMQGLQLAAGLKIERWA